MFKIFNRQNFSQTDILTSRLYNEVSFYPTFIRDLKNCQSQVIIESPYMTCARTEELIPIFRKLKKKGVHIYVNTRNPNDHELVLKNQAWLVTKQLQQIGVKVRFYKNLNHRKVAVLDGSVLYEGSLNILSQRRSSEVMRRIHSVDMSKQMIKFLGVTSYYR